MIRGLLGLQGKFVISLLIAAALPLFIGLVAFEVMSYRHMVAERGQMHRLESSGLAGSITQSARAEAEKLRVWMSSAVGIKRFAAEMSAQMQSLSPLRLADKLRHTDDVWVAMPDDEPIVKAILENPVAAELRDYQRAHAQVAEVFVTDVSGRVIAATAKTSDYSQADEHWWQKGASLADGECWSDAVHFDNSSGVFTMDIALPLHWESRLVGVVKMSVEVSKLVPQLIMRGVDTASEWYFVLRSGQILVSSDARITPLQNRMPYEIISGIKSMENGWMVGGDQHGEDKILGFTALGSDYVESNAFIVFSSASSDLFDTLWENFIGLMLVAGTLLVLCMMVGFYIIQRRILRPIGMIDGAVRSVSLLSKLHKNPHQDPKELLEQHHRVEADLRLIQKIRTGDQIEMLAREIATLISRVIHYQSEVDKEERARLAARAKEEELAAEAAEAESKQGED